MADINMKDFVDALTADTSPESTDLVYVRTSAGNRKMTVQNLLNGIGSLAIKGRYGGDIGGYLMDGVDDYITVPDDANLDFGLSDFSLELFVRLADYTPYAELVLLEKHASNLGFKVLLSTAGKLKLQFGNGTNFTTFSYESDAVGTTDDSWAHFLVTADRDGNALYYVNGILNKTVGISGSVAQTLDNTGALNVFGNGTSYTAGRVAIIRAYNRILTATETANIFNNGRPDLYESSYNGKLAGVKYTSNYASGVDNTIGGRATVAAGTASEDGITDGVTSYDNVLSAYASADNNDHLIVKNVASTIFKRCREKFKIYIPTANTNVNGFAIGVAGTTTLLTVNSLTVKKVVDGSSYGTVSGNYCNSCAGFWLDVVADVTYPAYADFDIFLTKTGSITFIGANSASDDLIYIYDYTRTVLGAIYKYIPPNAGSLGWIESSGNQLSAATSGSPICLTKEARPPHYRDIRKAIAANTNTTLTNIVPKGYKIVSIRAKGSDSLADIKIGSASAGEQIVAATTTSSTTPKLLTLAATANDAYSESADVTLYARHDTSASGKTMDLIFHFEKVGN